MFYIPKFRMIAKSVLAITALASAAYAVTGETVTASGLADTTIKDEDGIGAGVDSYTFYQGDGTTADGWPSTDDWWVCHCWDWDARRELKLICYAIGFPLANCMLKKISSLFYNWEYVNHLHCQQVRSQYRIHARRLRSIRCCRWLHRRNRQHPDRHRSHCRWNLRWPPLHPSGDHAGIYRLRSRTQLTRFRNQPRSHARPRRSLYLQRWNYSSEPLSRERDWGYDQSRK